MNCDQCQALMINGVFCHETGCPNSRKTWIEDRQAWILFLPCSACGCQVEVGEHCGCEDSEQWITDDDAELEEDSRNAHLTRIAEFILAELNAGNITFDNCEESLAALSELTDDNLTFGIPE